MSEQTPLEAAEAFLETSKFKQDGAVVSGQAWDADHNGRHLRYGTLRALVAQIRLDEQRLADRDRLAAENKDLRNKIATLRHILDTLKPILIPIWERVLTQVQAAWKILEPILDAIDAEPRHGDGNICKVCDRGIVYRQVTDPNGTVIHAEWQHKIEPADGHQAAPPLYGSRYRTKSEPKHGDSGVCKVCGGEIEYVEHQQGNGAGEYEVLDAWWSHRTHPADGHDAQPAPPGFQFVGTTDGGVVR